MSLISLMPLQMDSFLIFLLGVYCILNLYVDFVSCNFTDFVTFKILLFYRVLFFKDQVIANRDPFYLSLSDFGCLYLFFLIAFARTSSYFMNRSARGTFNLFLRKYSSASSPSSIVMRLSYMTCICPGMLPLYNLLRASLL